jgi:hypothetical protein
MVDSGSMVCLAAIPAGLAALGGIVWIWNRSRLKFWYASALTSILIGLPSLQEYTLARPFLPADPSQSVRQVVAFCLAGASLLLALIALSVHKLKPFKAQQE